MNKQDVFNLCKVIAPQYNFDPYLVCAICEQESSYDEKAVRLENGFYRRYVKNNKELAGYDITDKVLFSCSWGLMQIMGLNLWYLNGVPAYGEFETFSKIPDLQIIAGCQWLDKTRKESSTDDVKEWLQRYNGAIHDTNQVYANGVLTKMERLKGEL